MNPRDEEHRVRHAGPQRSTSRKVQPVTSTTVELEGGKILTGGLR